MQASWMILASLFFSMMGVCVKFASAHFQTFELVFFRGLIGVIFMASICRIQGISLRTPIPLMHAWRSVVGVTSLAAWFYAIGYLPLATAMTLNYMSSIWVAVFLVGGTLVMGRLQDATRQGPIVLTVIAGFLVDLHPHFEIEQWFAFNAAYGFITCLLMIVGAKALGLFIKRPDNYYARDEHDE